MQAEENERGKMDVDGIIGADKDVSEPVALEFPPQPPGRTEKVSFATFCDLLEALEVEPRHARRVEILRDFREKYLTVRKLFWIFFSCRAVGDEKKKEKKRRNSKLVFFSPLSLRRP